MEIELVESEIIKVEENGNEWTRYTFAFNDVDRTYFQDADVVNVGEQDDVILNILFDELFNELHNE